MGFIGVKLDVTEGRRPTVERDDGERRLQGIQNAEKHAREREDGVRQLALTRRHGRSRVESSVNERISVNQNNGICSHVASIGRLRGNAVFPLPLHSDVDVLANPAVQIGA